MVGLCILADDKRQLQSLERSQERLSPRRGALGAWGKIACLTRARKTKSHGKDCDILRIVENVGGHPQPLAKAVATGIGEGHTRLVNLPARRLSGYQNARTRMELDDGSWAERQMRGAKSTVANLSKK